jgi:hypothetical protein
MRWDIFGSECLCGRNRDSRMRDNRGQAELHSSCGIRHVKESAKSMPVKPQGILISNNVINSR